jgi:hypothetical protein
MTSLVGLPDDCDHQAPVARKVASQLAGDLPSIHKRHFDIKEHDVWVLSGSHLQSGRAVIGPAGRVSPSTCQAGNTVGRLRIVIDDQDAERPPIR